MAQQNRRRATLRGRRVSRDLVLVMLMIALSLFVPNRNLLAEDNKDDPAKTADAAKKSAANGKTRATEHSAATAKQKAMEKTVATEQNTGAKTEEPGGTGQNAGDAKEAEHQEKPAHAEKAKALRPVEVIGVTPVKGLGLPARLVPGAVQVVGAKEIQTRQSTNLGSLLNQTVAGVNVAEAQGNPFQLNVDYRGFSASPLVGTPQGLSVYQDGVRINEPFGDVVNWDLIPKDAIANIDVIPGSNPVFGLNTLGGALSIRTKDGFAYPGTWGEVDGGSFGRRYLAAGSGASHGHFAYFTTLRQFEEDGWRPFSTSHNFQFFGKGTYKDDLTEIDLSETFAHSRLYGAQALPPNFLDIDRTQIYTAPDKFTNKLSLSNLQAQHLFGDNWLLSGNAYFRLSNQTLFNSNVNNDYDPGQPITTSNSPANNVLSQLRQNGYGGALQLSYLGDILGYQNQLSGGATYDRQEVTFQQATQPGVFTPDRYTIGFGRFNQGLVSVDGTNRYLGLYFTDTFSPHRMVHFTVAGRYDDAAVGLRDQIGTALTGSHDFTRFNPSAGITLTPLDNLRLYFNYSEGLRAPMQVELACASPSAPCTLPNNLVSDPSLKPVVAHTFETGLGGQWREADWSLSFYRTDLYDDIVFASGKAPSSGFFINVPDTRRQGVDFKVSGTIKKVDWLLSYNYVDATYQSSFSMSSPFNSTANSLGAIQVRSGDRIPNIPRHQIKLRLQYNLSPQSEIGMTLLAFSGTYPQGDDNNLDVNGRLPGYVLLNFDAQYQVTRRWVFLANIENLLNTDYETYGILGQNFFPGPNERYSPRAPVNTLFATPGAPFGIWAGLRYVWSQS